MKKLCLFSTTLLAVIFAGSILHAQTYYTRIAGAWNNNTNVWSTVSHSGLACSCEPGASLSGTKVVNIYTLNT